MKQMALLQYLQGLMLTIFIVGFSLGATANESKRVTADDLKQIDMLEDWGVEPVHIKVTAAGYMIEFRYKVIDSKKAAILSGRGRENFPYLQALKSKARLAVPFGATVGFLKSNQSFVEKGKNYIAMFSNEGQHLLPGDKVKIEIKNQISPVLTLQ